MVLQFLFANACITSRTSLETELIEVNDVTDLQIKHASTLVFEALGLDLQ